MAVVDIGQVRVFVDEQLMQMRVRVLKAPIYRPRVLVVMVSVVMPVSMFVRDRLMSVLMAMLLGQQ